MQGKENVGNGKCREGKCTDIFRVLDLYSMSLSKTQKLWKLRIFISSFMFLCFRPHSMSCSETRKLHCSGVFNQKYGEVENTGSFTIFTDFKIFVCKQSLRVSITIYVLDKNTKKLKPVRNMEFDFPCFRPQAIFWP